MRKQLPVILASLFVIALAAWAALRGRSVKPAAPPVPSQTADDNDDDDDGEDEIAGASMTREALGRALRERLPRVAVAIEAHIHDSIRVHEAAAAAPVPIGVSRIGGTPDLPPATRWPAGHKGPLAFIAQIRLAEVAALDREHLLPRAGTLYFFYDAVEQPWGFRHSDRGGWHVWHDAGDPARLVPAAFPATLAKEARFRPRAITFTPEPMLPDDDALALEPLKLSQSERAAYGKLREQSRAPAPLHRLLGHPDPVQGEMQLEVQLTSHGIDTGDGKGYQQARAAELRPGASQWRLLFQIDTSDDADMMWGDTGMVYFWIPLASLRAGKFDDVWAILQCG